MSLRDRLLKRGPATLWVQPPAPDADRRARLIFMRDLNARTLLLMLVLLATTLVVGAGALAVLAGVFAATNALSVASLQRKIRRG